MSNQNKAIEKIAAYIKGLITSSEDIWIKPYIAGSGIVPENFVSGWKFQGMNSFLSQISGFDLPLFATFKQGKSKGFIVKKGSKGIPFLRPSFYYFDAEGKKVEPSEFNPEVHNKRVFFSYHVMFNIDQFNGTDDIKAEYIASARPDSLEPKNRIEVLDNLLKSKKSRYCKVIYRDGTPCYTPATDKIAMPELAQFNQSVGFYGTLFHEIGHSTGHESRLDRLKKQTYPVEEVTAETFSTMILKKEGFLTMFEEQNSAAYLKGWASRIAGKKDEELMKGIMGACKALDYFYEE